MRRFLITALLALCTLAGQAQINAEANEPVELMAILAHTAGYQEYSQNLAAQYSKDTEEWFAPYKQHEAVALAWKLHTTYSIGHEKVMSMAIHLDIEKGEIKFLGDKSDLVENWKDVDIEDFIQKLNQFYKDTRFHEFFEQHRTFYEEYISNYEMTGTMAFPFNLKWYPRFHYGTEEMEPFKIYICFTYGGHNNGMYRKLSGKPRELFAIMGYVFNPAIGRPYMDFSLLWHEVNHPYVNPLLDNEENAKLMEPIGQKLLELSREAMKQQAYTDWHIVINESIVRASTIIYAQDAGYKQETPKILMELEVKRNGFPWMPQLVDCLRNYANNRDKYKTLNDYYPEIAKCLQKYIEYQKSPEAAPKP